MAKHWYSFSGPNSPTITEATAVSNYFYTDLYGAQISAACLAGPKICAIYATGVVSSAPDGPLSVNVRQYIANALLSKTAQPTTGKRYVYAQPNS